MKMTYGVHDEEAKAVNTEIVSYQLLNYNLISCMQINYDYMDGRICNCDMQYMYVTCI